MANTISRLISGGVLLSGGRAITNLLAFASTIILARLLTPDDFGIVALGTTVMAIITSVTEMSMANALIHHDRPTDEHLQNAWTLGAVRGLILAAIMAAGAIPFANIYGDPRLEFVIYAFAGSVFVSGLFNPRQAMLTKELVFYQEFLLLVANRLIMVASSIILAFVWGSYWAMIVGVLLGQITNVVLSYALLPFRPKIEWKHTRELFSFSMWLTFGQAINTINWRFDQLLVGGILGTATLGHYSVGSNLAQMPTREVSSPLRSTLFPALSQLKHEPYRLRHAYQRAQSLIVFLALPVGVGFALVAQGVVIVAMGEKWLPAVAIIQALSVVFALQTLGSLVQPLGMALGHTKMLFVRDMQMFCIRLPLILGGTLLFGLVGLIYSRVASGLIGLMVQMILVRRMTEISVLSQISVNWRSLLASGVMAATVLFDQSVNRLIGFDTYEQTVFVIRSIFVGSVAYAATIVVLWFVTACPDGPEKEFAGLTRKIVFRLIGKSQLK